ncbi:paraquat-inducible protein A [Brenneria tiliae]|uniref:Paraquat-inducible protein A n=1 Tax=Brenneria tiliae TaxID=2914984 RepID=A0ABT0MZ33_9GAMM|nr:paraquat-inducible protein A [Brenneria tiliae]MCL2895105.1 paraquat-inducible protein A [Brenneria tiliae]MCL2899376.1 paraquat-inducible protein A [Brenneria tiliae]MCL2903754.1 paraquat-inducible protein A [Brenneria tiliae]
MSQPSRARRLGVIGCHCCGLACRYDHAERHPPRCPRCHSPLRHRHAAGHRLPLALLLTAIILYVPANVLPVMSSTLLGRGGDSTISGGIIDFWQSGSYGIALLIFVASVVVPGTKFLALGLLLLTSAYRSRWAMRERAALYRLTELIGYWSMLDVVVVAIVSALVKFNALSEVEPRSGILFFGLVVIFTMLSAMSYDPRLIWDGENDAEQI